jgi:hypothetical protein|nr:hypothetical protein [uncultured Acetatifactor sp.]
MDYIEEGGSQFQYYNSMEVRKSNSFPTSSLNKKFTCNRAFTIVTIDEEIKNKYTFPHLL